MKLSDHQPYEGILAEPGGELPALLPALLAHYEITPEPLGQHWMELALSLATHHVPGFHPAPRAQTDPGRRPHRVLDDLVILVEMFKAEEAGESIREAARRMADDRDRRPKGMSADTIRSRYHRLKKAGAEFQRVGQLLALLNKYRS